MIVDFYDCRLPIADCRLPIADCRLGDAPKFALVNLNPHSSIRKSALANLQSAIDLSRGIVRSCLKG
jgi:hypothetical protein